MAQKIAVMAAVLFGSLTLSQSAFAGVSGGNNGQEKVTICHVDQKTGEGKTITVGAPAVGKHLANHDGDHIGECDDLPNTSGPNHIVSCECGSVVIPIEDTICFDVNSQDSLNQIFAYCTDICEGDLEAVVFDSGNPECSSG